MRVLLLSTYELGHQPLGIAAPAAVLESAGHETRPFDLSQVDLPAAAVEWADALVVSVPMHTATRLGSDVIGRLRSARPALPVAFHGLYAPVVAAAGVAQPGDLLVAGDPSGALLDWLAALGAGAPAPDRLPPVRIDLGPVKTPASGPPLRRGLPPLSQYAKFARGSDLKVVASVAASHGCNHTCRHCPVAPIYGGRSRPIALETVMADIDQVVELGAEHVSFADPDFLNRPGHAREIAGLLHRRHPTVSFDATVKIEHILRHEQLWPELAAAGLVFLTSAFESRDDYVLQLLEKGHSAAEEQAAVGVARGSGIEIRPSWMPFTPWTTIESVADLLEFSAKADLVWSTDAVQYSIRLLLPAGSLLLDDADLGLEPEWVAADRRLDDLQLAIAARAELGTTTDETPAETFAGIWEVARKAGARLASTPPPPDTPWLPGPERPRLTESWFCCAEPTAAQLTGVGRLSRDGDTAQVGAVA
jgi:radical SAM superfamily enzyme YgiQ (UPF0313 family)